MAIGTTLGLIALGTAAVGTTVSAVGQVKAGNAAKRAAEFNAQVAELQSQDALARGAEDESRFRSQVRQLIGSQRAAFAGQGVDVGTGSAAAVQGDTAFLGELDALTIRQNAAREAWGFQTDAQSMRLGGQAAQSAGRWGAAGTALGGGGSLLLTGYGWQRGKA